MISKLMNENNITIEELAKKSKVAIDVLSEYIERPNKLTLLNACKIGIGFQKLGVFANEYTLIGEDKCGELFEETMMRCMRKKGTDEDYEYLELQESTVLGVGMMKRRIDKGLSRKQLSEKTGVDVRSIEKYETGERKIRDAASDRIYSLAKGLNCRMEDLMVRERLK